MLPKEKTLPADTFTTKSDNFKMTRYTGTSDLSCSKTNKIKSFNDWAYFYLMLIVAPLTFRSNDVRSRDAE